MSEGDSNQDPEPRIKYKGPRVICGYKSKRGVEMVEASTGKWLCDVPGHTPDEWQLSLKRASDPFMPTPMKKDMEAMKSGNGGEEREADSLAHDYAYGLLAMEAGMLRVATDPNTGGETRRILTDALRKLYERIWDARKKLGDDPSVNDDRKRRDQLQKSAEWEEGQRWDSRPDALAGKITKPINPEVRKWTTAEMWDVHHLVFENVRINRRRSPDSDGEPEPVAVPNMRHYQGFVEFWQKWLENHLHTRWEMARDERAQQEGRALAQKNAADAGKSAVWLGINGDPVSKESLPKPFNRGFKTYRSGIMRVAAEFWVREMWRFEITPEVKARRAAAFAALRELSSF